MISCYIRCRHNVKRKEYLHGFRTKKRLTAHIIAGFLYQHADVDLQAGSDTMGITTSWSNLLRDIGSHCAGRIKPDPTSSRENGNGTISGMGTGKVVYMRSFHLQQAPCGEPPHLFLGEDPADRFCSYQFTVLLSLPTAFSALLLDMVYHGSLIRCPTSRLASTREQSSHRFASGSIVSW